MDIRIMRIMCDRVTSLCDKPLNYYSKIAIFAFQFVAAAASEVLD